jgi:hypothetical protein
MTYINILYSIYFDFGDETGHVCQFGRRRGSWREINPETGRQRASANAASFELKST